MIFSEMYWFSIDMNLISPGASKYSETMVNVLRLAMMCLKHEMFGWSSFVTSNNFVTLFSFA